MKDTTPIQLNEDFQYALDLLEKTPQSAFITGRAGTGKSTLLRLFKATTRKQAVVLAPTGLAALNIGGQTIHSFFNLPPKPVQRNEIRPAKPHIKKMYEKLQVLIIDEISMVRADLLDAVDWVLRLNRNNLKEPFGGVQVVFFGDLFQLPPVVRQDEEQILAQQSYESPFFFSAKVLKEGSFQLEMIELQTVFRQESLHFIRLLDAIRLNQMEYDEFEELNSRVVPVPKETEDFYITLSPRNQLVDELNSQRLRALPTEQFTYLASVTGSFSPNSFPADTSLHLREGAQVIFLKNDQRRRFVNGTIGKIVHLSMDTIRVETRIGSEVQEIDVEKYEWEIMQHALNDAGVIETKTVGTFSQYPLRLAWAMTIHKSQGKTFEKVIIDMGKGAFAAGQTYVALSRCTSLEGIFLKRPVEPRDIFIDERIIDFYEQQR